MHQGGACQPTDSDSCWLVAGEIVRASRVPAGGQTTLHASQAGVQQHHTSLGPLPGVLLEACSRCGPLPDRWDKVRADISEARFEKGSGSGSSSGAQAQGQAQARHRTAVQARSGLSGRGEAKLLGCRFQSCRNQQGARREPAVIVCMLPVWRSIGVYGSPHS